MSNEKEIRKACKDFFDLEFDVELYDEFSQQIIPVRPDLFGAKKKTIYSIEIKSDKDSFTRLERQLLEYRHFSNSIWVALDHTHIDKFLKGIGNNGRFHSVGILSYKNGKLSIIRKAYVYKLPLLYPYLWNDELLQFFSLFKGRSKIEKNAQYMCDRIEQIYTYREIEDISRKLFLSRVKGKIPKDLFENIDLELKQQKFEELL